MKFLAYENVDYLTDCTYTKNTFFSSMYTYIQTYVCIHTCIQYTNTHICPNGSYAIYACIYTKYNFMYITVFFEDVQLVIQGSDIISLTVTTFIAKTR